MSEASDAPRKNGPVVLFDGECVFCDRTVGLLMRLDGRGVLRYAPLQSEAGGALRSAYEVPESVDSIVLVHEGEAYVHSEAALRIAGLLGLPWSLAGVFWLVPRAIQDWLYRFIARHRYRIFGRRESCRMPGEGERGRVLERIEEVGGLLEAARSGPTASTA